MLSNEERKDYPSLLDISGPEELEKAVAENTVAVTPFPGFVIKTRVTGASAEASLAEGIKVFINVCHHESVPGPPASSPEQISLAMQGLRITNINIGLNIILLICIGTNTILLMQR